MHSLCLQLPLETVIDDSKMIAPLSDKKKKKLWTLRNSVFKPRARTSDARGMAYRSRQTYGRAKHSHALVPQTFMTMRLCTSMRLRKTGAACARRSASSAW